MIIERLVWRARFGQGDTVTDAFGRWKKDIAPRFGLGVRILVDVTGPMFTVVVESEYRDMAHVAEVAPQLQTLYGEAEFQLWFNTWQGAVEHGSRELFTVIG